MTKLPYYLVNVFAETHFGGNPLAVFTNAAMLNDTQMQAIAKQFNLSETVFIQPSNDDHVVANLRIFTPNYEMPFAGHPTLGASFVLSQLNNLPDQFIINTQAKAVHIHRDDVQIFLTISGFEVTPCQVSQAYLADVCQINSNKINHLGYFVNSGTTQFLLQLDSLDDLLHAKIDLIKLQELFAKHCPDTSAEPSIYLWHQDKHCEEIIHSRMLFEQDGIIIEDTGTGSACANLGAYLIHQGLTPTRKTIHQGDHLGRANRLYLNIDTAQNIQVGGRVVMVGTGEFWLDG